MKKKKDELLSDVSNELVTGIMVGLNFTFLSRLGMVSRKICQVLQIKADHFFFFF